MLVCLNEIEVSAFPSPMIIPTVSKTHWLFCKVFKSLNGDLNLEPRFSVSTVTVNLWILKYLKTVLSSLYKNTRSHCCILFNLCLAFIHNLTLKNFKLIVLLQMPTLIPYFKLELKFIGFGKAYLDGYFVGAITCNKFAQNIT